MQVRHATNPPPSETLAGVLTTSASLRFTVWTNAMLTGACDPDTAAQKILGDDVGHHVADRKSVV